MYRKIPLLVPGVSQFLNANNSVFNYLKVETNIDLKSLFSPLINPVLNYSIRQFNTKLFAFEKFPIPGTKSGVFRYIYFLKI